MKIYFDIQVPCVEDDCRSEERRVCLVLHPYRSAVLAAEGTST